MVVIERTEEFENWFQRLRDQRARDRVLARIRRLSLGNPGHVNAVGEGISELKIDYGPGYRVYFVKHGERYVLLHGGDKSSQDRDIQRARQLSNELRN